MSLLRSAVIVFALLSLEPYFAYAWGKEGHVVTCKLAQRLLSKAAQKAVKDLLTDRDLASLCSWADRMKGMYRWSKPLHYINTPDNNCSYDYARDCHNDRGEEGMCLEGAINNYRAQLETYWTESFSSNNLTEALLFLSHFMGDIHQPLHVGFTSDEGGNKIRVSWFSEKHTLHHVWDTRFIQKAMNNSYNNDLEVMTNDIHRNINVSDNLLSNTAMQHFDEGLYISDSCLDDVSTWQIYNDVPFPIAFPNTYAKESIDLACKWAYKDAENESVLKDNYFHSRLPIVLEQLAKGGVRLAATLNQTLGKNKGHVNHDEL